MKTVTAILLFGISATAIAVGLTFQQERPDEKSNLEKLESFVKENSGTIDVSGTIEDQDGNALEDVEIEVAEVSPYDMFGNLTNRKTSVGDGRFRIKRRGVSSIECRFLKRGYYVERRSFSFFGQISDSKENVLSDQAVVIRLQKKPESAPLEKFEGYLRTDLSGPTSVLYTMKAPLSDTPLTAEQIEERSRLNLQRPHIYLDPDMEGGGRLSRVFIDVKGIGGLQTILRLGRIALSQPDPGDGFLDAEISNSSSRVAVGFRRLTDSPLEGYGPYLLISAESGDEDKFFYCRIHGNYGKGVVTNVAPILTDDGIESAGAKIIIFLNPTGSRDVSYFHP
jgi:hypothetical protein